MNAIALDADGCRSAILDYRRRVRTLLGLVRHAGRLDEAHPARGGLAELRARLEADVRLRSTFEGQGAMSGLEQRVLEPALRQARIALAFPLRAEGEAWVPHLQAADACFLVALSRLNDLPECQTARVRRVPGRARG
jgi:hypothetical protein